MPDYSYISKADMTFVQAPIAIIGAGPAGLLLARLLHLANVANVVFERNISATWADEHSSSGTLDIHKDTGQAALEEAGLIDKFKAIARWGVAVKFADSQGNVVFETDHTNVDGDKPEIDRKELQRLLLDSIPADNIHWDCAVESVQADSDGTHTMHFKSGKVASGFRLVVGADGAWSKVRKLVSSAKPQYSGIHFFTTFLRPENPHYSSLTSMAGKGNYLAFSKGRHFYLHYLGDRSYHLGLGMQLPDTWTQEASVLYDSSTLWQSLLQHEFAEWAPKMTTFMQSSNEQFRSWPMCTLCKDDVPWAHTPGVTLIGDAAHLAIPGGDGVNNALYDSLELARRVIKHGIDDVDSAVIEYERNLFPCAIKAIEKGQWTAEHLFRADSPQSFLEAAAHP